MRRCFVAGDGADDDEAERGVLMAGALTEALCLRSSMGKGGGKGAQQQAPACCALTPTDGADDDEHEEACFLLPDHHKTKASAASTEKGSPAAADGGGASSVEEDEEEDGGGGDEEDGDDYGRLGGGDDVRPVGTTPAACSRRTTVAPPASRTGGGPAGGGLERDAAGRGRKAQAEEEEEEDNNGHAARRRARAIDRALREQRAELEEAVYGPRIAALRAEVGRLRRLQQAEEEGASPIGGANPAAGDAARRSSSAGIIARLESKLRRQAADLADYRRILGALDGEDVEELLDRARYAEEDRLLSWERARILQRHADEAAEGRAKAEEALAASERRAKELAYQLKDARVRLEAARRQLRGEGRGPIFLSADGEGRVLFRCTLCQDVCEDHVEHVRTYHAANRNVAPCPLGCGTVLLGRPAPFAAALSSTSGVGAGHRQPPPQGSAVSQADIDRHTAGEECRARLGLIRRLRAASCYPSSSYSVMAEDGGEESMGMVGLDGGLWDGA